MFYCKISNKHELRLLNVSDSQELDDLINKNRFYLREWLSWLDKNSTLDDTISFINSSIELNKDKRSFETAIIYDGKLVGVIGLSNIDLVNRKALLGYWIDKDMQHKGIITNSCKAIINYAFQELGLNRIEIKVAIDNHKSRAIPEKLGFTMEGISRQSEWLYDKFLDMAIYSMLKAENS